MQKLQSLSNSALYWGIFVTLIFIPLYLKFPLFNVTGSFVSIRLDDILIAVVFLLWLINLLISGDWKKLVKDKLFLSIICFFFVGAVSLFSAVFLTKTVQLSLAVLHYARRVELFFLIPIVFSAIKNKKQGMSLLVVSLIVLVLVNGYALGQRYLHFPVVSTTTSELSKGEIYYLQPTDRVSSTFAGFYDLAIYMLMAITILTPIIYYIFILKKGQSIIFKEKFVWFFSFILLAAISFIILIMTATRLSFAAAVFGIFVSLILIGKKRLILLVVLLVTISLIYPSNLRNRFVSTFTVNIQRSWDSFTAPNRNQEQRSLLNIPTLPNSKFNNSPDDQIGLATAPDITPGEPTNSTDLGVYRSFDIRIKVEWPRAVRALLKNPFLGSGYSSLGLATDNDILRSLGEVGILGTIAFGLIIIETGKRIFFISRKTTGFVKYLSIGVFSMLLAFITNSLFIDVFESSKVSILFWIILGITIVLGKLELNENNK